MLLLSRRLLYKPAVYIYKSPHVQGLFTRLGAVHHPCAELAKYQRIRQWRGPLWITTHQPFVDAEQELRRIAPP